SMEPGDVILTPSWTFHGHAHEGMEKMLWLDVLDVPLVRSVDAQFYEEYSQPRTLQQAEKHVDESALFSYKWAETRELLHRSSDGDTLTLKNRTTGGPIMPTINASMQLVRSGQRAKARRSLGNYIHHVVEGSGYSIIDGQRFDWNQHDTFCVPTW